MSIKLSPKHGVNPSVLLCPICGKDTGLALQGLIGGYNKDIEAPRQQLDREPCDFCKVELSLYKEQGFVFLVVHDDFEKVDREKYSPWQFFTRLAVVKKDAKFLEYFDTSAGAAFIPESGAKKIGF